MTVKIDKKIKSYSVKSTEEELKKTEQEKVVVEEKKSVVEMHEKIDRPEILRGSTYKIKSVALEHAMYVTINDIVLNEGTESEKRYPFEIFINSKNMEQFQWIVALTRIASAVFRKGGDIVFLVDELKAVFDPKGGYFKPGGIFVPSVVAEIGLVIEKHLKSIGLLESPELSQSQKDLIEKKKKEALGVKEAAHDSSNQGEQFPPNATLCPKCNHKSMVILDGCQTCLNCGHSKCG